MVHQKVLTFVSLKIPESGEKQNAVTSKKRRGLVQSENPGDIPY